MEKFDLTPMSDELQNWTKFKFLLHKILKIKQHPLK